MLAKENRDELKLAMRGLQPRKNELLLLLLVVVLDKTADEPSCAGDDRRLELLRALDAACALIVDEQDAFEHTMLLHQVFSRSDLCLLS